MAPQTAQAGGWGGGAVGGGGGGGGGVERSFHCDPLAKRYLAILCMSLKCSIQSSKSVRLLMYAPKILFCSVQHIMLN